MSTPLDPQAVEAEVSRLVRGMRKAVRIRFGEMSLGLPRRIWMPFIWTQTQVGGVGRMMEKIEFLGVRVFLDQEGDSH